LTSVLIGASSAGETLLLGLGFLGVGCLSLAITKWWYPDVRAHPPRESSIAYEHWRLAQRLVPAFAVMLNLGAIASLIAGAIVFGVGMSML
jgi:hypothetical protein